MSTQTLEAKPAERGYYYGQISAQGQWRWTGTGTPDDKWEPSGIQRPQKAAAQPKAPEPATLDPRTTTEVDPSVVQALFTPGPSPAFWHQTGLGSPSSGASLPTLPDFSLEEQTNGRLWIDGKAIYQKTIQIPSIPSGESSVAHGISNIDHVIEIQGSAFDGTHYFRIPHVDPMYPTYEVGVWADANNLGLRAGTGDLSAFTWVYLTMYYTCTDR